MFLQILLSQLIDTDPDLKQQPELEGQIVLKLSPK